VERRRQQQPQVGLRLATPGGEPHGVDETCFVFRLDQKPNGGQQKADLKRAPLAEPTPGAALDSLVHQLERPQYRRVLPQDSQACAQPIQLLEHRVGGVVRLGAHRVRPPLSSLPCVQSGR